MAEETWMGWLRARLRPGGAKVRAGAWHQPRKIEPINYQCRELLVCRLPTLISYSSLDYQRHPPYRVSHIQHYHPPAFISILLHFRATQTKSQTLSLCEPELLAAEASRLCFRGIGS
jgi:hypothetical protein